MVGGGENGREEEGEGKGEEGGKKGRRGGEGRRTLVEPAPGSARVRIRSWKRRRRMREMRGRCMVGGGLVRGLLGVLRVRLSGGRFGGRGRGLEDVAEEGGGGGEEDEDEGEEARVGGHH